MDILFILGFTKLPMVSFRIGHPTFSLKRESIKNFDDSPFKYFIFRLWEGAAINPSTTSI